MWKKVVLQVFCNDFFDIFDSHLDLHLSFSLNLAACLESLSLQKVQLKPSDKRSYYFQALVDLMQKNISTTVLHSWFFSQNAIFSMQQTHFPSDACFVCVKFAFLGITICKSYLQVL